MATTPEKDFHTDLEAIRSDIAALTENVGKLANEASKGCCQSNANSSPKVARHRQPSPVYLNIA